MGSVGSGRDRTECEGACGPAQRAGGGLVSRFPFEDGPGSIVRWPVSIVVVLRPALAQQSVSMRHHSQDRRWGNRCTAGCRSAVPSSFLTVLCVLRPLYTRTRRILCAYNESFFRDRRVVVGSICEYACNTGPQFPLNIYGTLFFSLLPQ